MSVGVTVVKKVEGEPQQGQIGEHSASTTKAKQEAQRENQQQRKKEEPKVTEGHLTQEEKDWLNKVLDSSEASEAAIKDLAKTKAGKEWEFIKVNDNQFPRISAVKTLPGGLIEVYPKDSSQKACVYDAKTGKQVAATDFSKNPPERVTELSPKERIIGIDLPLK